MIAPIRHRLISLVVAAVVGVSAAILPLVVSMPAQAQAKPAAHKKAVHKKSAPVKRKSARKSPGSSAVSRRAEAFRKYKDYQYVKSMSPYAGSAYKWGSPW